MRLISYLSQQTKSNYFITTPIFYVNSIPHLGHLHTALLADAQARWKAIKGQHAEVLFTTGTDEHGYKIQKKALANNIDCRTYCDSISGKFKDLFQLAAIKHTDFIRTTERRHSEAVVKFWSQLVDKGFIYKSSYNGWYSVNDECFLTENQTELKPSTQTNELQRVSKESGHIVEHTSETNYMFKLSNFKSQLHRYLETGIIMPKNYKEILTEQIENLEDLSVSREASRVHWGIPVPNDPSQIIYVWLDALVNYMTSAGYPKNMNKFNEVWPADVHVIGKDILRFHAIYWPSFLMAAGFKLPRRILCHGHWLVDNKKMSKSIGNVIDPFESLEKYTQNGLRYFLLREGVPDTDSNISVDKFTKFANVELSNTLGNLYQRCLPFNTEKVYPSYTEVKDELNKDDLELIDRLNKLGKECDDDFEVFNFYKGIQNIMTSVRMCNNLVQEYKPWTLKKSTSPADIAKINKLLFLVYETMRISSILLQPIVPSLADDLLSRIGVEHCQRMFVHASVDKLSPAKKISLPSSILFKRL